MSKIIFKNERLIKPCLLKITLTKKLQSDYKSVANELQIKRIIIVQTFTKSSDIMIIIGDSHKRGEIKNEKENCNYTR